MKLRANQFNSPNLDSLTCKVSNNAEYLGQVPLTHSLILNRQDSKPDFRQTVWLCNQRSKLNDSYAVSQYRVECYYWSNVVQCRAGSPLNHCISSAQVSPQCRNRMQLTTTFIRKPIRLNRFNKILLYSRRYVFCLCCVHRNDVYQKSLVL